MQDQNLPNTATFTFDEYSLAAVAGSAHTLNLSNTRLQNCQPLYYCDRIETLNIQQNLVSDIEHVLPLLQTMRCLRMLDLSENPVTKTPKYRERVIMEGKMLMELDGKDVRQQDRKYLFAL